MPAVTAQEQAGGETDGEAAVELGETTPPLWYLPVLSQWKWVQRSLIKWRAEVAGVEQL